MLSIREPSLSFLALLALASCDVFRIPEDTRPARRETCDEPADISPENDRVYDFVFPKESTVLVLVSNGTFVRSDDGGQHWTIAEQMSSGGRVDARSIHFLAVGVEGSVWGVYADRPRDPDETRQSQLIPSGIAVTRDGGDSFEVIRFDRSMLTPGGLIELNGTDPLVQDFFSGQLWAHLAGGEDTPESFGPWGVPNPDDCSGPGVSCGGAVWLATGSIGEQTIWCSSDAGVTWTNTRELGSGDIVSGFACGPEMDLWAVIGNSAVLRYDARVDSWREVVVLGDLGRFCAGSVQRALEAASDGALLYVIAETPGERRFVLSVSARGFVEELGRLPIDDRTLHRIKVDSDGVPWVAGRGLFRVDRDTHTWEQVWPAE